MAYRDILLALTTYPEPTPVSAVEHAVSFADALGARVSAIACEVEIQVPGRLNPFGNLLIDVPALVAAELQKSADNARDLLAAFEAAAQKAGVFQEKIKLRCPPAQVPEFFVQYARVRDLTIVPVPVGDYVDQWYAESVIFGSGHPTVILPHTMSGANPPALNTIVVAWDSSGPAARACWDAMPILEKAKVVRVVTVTDEKTFEFPKSSEELTKHLARHGVAVTLDHENAAGRKIGNILESYAISHQADLLVMGAYGHSKVREFVLGGATRSMLCHPPLPILLSH